MAKPTTQNNKDTFNDDDDDEFVKVDDVFPEPWKDMDKGDSIVGKYMGMGEISGHNNKPFTIYKLKNAEDELISVSGASLEARMALIPVGAKIKVTYMGTEPSKHGTPMKMFQVDVAKGVKLIEI
jgi:hypothetical protein